ncbi:DUF559 domain-containing protein [Leptolyngbya sp. NK1-12]|uniref:DUF559 domain-containing protein n=1 Tax=Leptolyngbya sp. NK1-12 TaxID=2547451 RepID=A0AA96WJ56_9CYAN|nr:DUF559 domain-containing protein [Leptolyngbya sp. NK1-12]
MGPSTCEFKKRGLRGAQQVERDAARTEQLHQLGYRVIRFKNQAVMSDLTAVLTEIVKAIDP